MILIAIDPGKSGALAVMEITDKVTLIEVIDTPVIGKEYNYHAIYALLKSLAPDRVVIENTLCLASSGTTTAKSVGIGEGMWKAYLACLNIPYEYIMPTVWTGTLKLPKSKGLTNKQNKDNHVSLACRLFPSHASSFYGVKGGLKDGRADATLIGEAWYRKSIKV